MIAGSIFLTYYVFVLGQRRTAGGKEAYMINYFAQVTISTVGGVAAVALTTGPP